jgi:AraC family transcriptional regulator of arabinose operon
MYVNTHLYADIDFGALANSHGMHPAAFRRRWMHEIGIPPARYLMHQRIKEACRLLVETSMPVGEIAGLLRFEDPLYFSRKFRSVSGLTATEYRRRYQSNLSLHRFAE